MDAHQYDNPTDTWKTFVERNREFLQKYPPTGGFSLETTITLEEGVSLTGEETKQAVPTYRIRATLSLNDRLIRCVHKLFPIEATSDFERAETYTVLRLFDHLGIERTSVEPVPVSQPSATVRSIPLPDFAKDEEDVLPSSTKSAEKPADTTEKKDESQSDEKYDYFKRELTNLAHARGVEVDLSGLDTDAIRKKIKELNAA